MDRYTHRQRMESLAASIRKLEVAIGAVTAAPTNRKRSVCITLPDAERILAEANESLRKMREKTDETAQR